MHLRKHCELFSCGFERASEFVPSFKPCRFALQVAQHVALAALEGSSQYVKDRVEGLQGGQGSGVYEDLEGLTDPLRRLIDR